MTITVTSEFREAYEAERTLWLRRRVFWYCAVSMGVTSMLLLGVVLGRLLSDAELPWLVTLLPAFAAMSKLAVYGWTYLTAQRHHPARDFLLRLVLRTVVIVGMIDVVAVPVLLWLVTAGSDRSNLGIEFSPTSEWFQLFLAHFFASLFIPWSPRESLRPLIPLLPAGALVMLLLAEGSFTSRVLFALLTPLAGVPGLAICWWRHGAFRSRFHLRMLRGHYGQLKQELEQAQRIHESVFPDPINDGPLRMDYIYRPVQQIGGDYLYAFTNRENGELRTLSIAMLDVTGHGIGAALTVNRLYGELERLYAEEPDRSPGETLTALNHYVHITLAKHSVYATGLVFCVDLDARALRWASAGHPPAFVRTPAGRVEQLDATAPMLGAWDDESFEADQQSLPFDIGHRLLAYTDGVIEATSHDGQMLRIEGMQRLVATATGESLRRGSLLKQSHDLLQDYRFGPSNDDTLIVEVTWPEKA